MICLSGAIAEHGIGGNVLDSAEVDLRMAGKWLRELPPGASTQVIDATARLVQHHYAIHALAAELLARRTMTGAQVEATIRAVTGVAPIGKSAGYNKRVVTG